MKAEEFIGKHPTQAFSCRVYRFSEYTLEVIENNQYLIGIKQEGEKKICSFEKKDRTELLCSLLSLYESFPSDIYTKINGSKSESFPDGEVEKITRWCVKYGMPMEDNEPDTTSRFIEHNGIKIEIPGGRKLWQKHGKIGFKIKDFYNRLHHLYTAYELWQKAYMGENNYDNFYTKKSVANMECVKLLEVNMSTLDIQLRPSFKEIPPTLELDCPDLMEIAKAQMFFECMSLGENSIGVCEICGSPFEKHRKNHMQCPKCQKAAYVRSRNKDKIQKNVKRKAAIQNNN